MPRPRRHLLNRIPFIHRRSNPGAAPGTMHIDPEAPPPRLTVMRYGPDGVETREAATIDDLGPLDGAAPVTWVNVDGLGDGGVLRAVGERAAVHRLVFEDIAHVHQRAKVEPYDEHLFIVVRQPHIGDHGETEQVSMILGKGTLVTFQERVGDAFDPVRKRIGTGSGRIRHNGADYLAYALIDALIDAYFPVLEAYGERIEALEEAVLTDRDPDVREIYTVKRELLALRRAVWPHREAINMLMREETEFVTDATRVYLRDCYDHVIQLIDMIETYRELAGGLLEIHLSAVSNRMNEIMKVLTIFAAIFIPLTFVVGVYGMNFQHMPELSWRWSYPVAWVIMIAIAVSMLLFFRRRGWLGGRNAPSARRRDDDSDR